VAEEQGKEMMDVTENRERMSDGSGASRCVWRGCERHAQEPEGLCVEHAGWWAATAAADGARDVLTILEPHKDLAGAVGEAIREACAVLEDDRRAASAEAAGFWVALRA
jgi:hypothetical protein